MLELAVTLTLILTLTLTLTLTRRYAHLEAVGQPAPQVGGDGDGGADEPLRRRPLRQLRGLGRG